VSDADSRLVVGRHGAKKLRGYFSGISSVFGYKSPEFRVENGKNGILFHDFPRIFRVVKSGFPFIFNDLDPQFHSFTEGRGRG